MQHEEQIEMIQNQLEESEQQAKQIIMSLEHDISLKDQKLLTYEQYLKETKEQLETTQA